MERLKNIYAHLLIFICIYIEFAYTVVVANFISGTIRSIILIAAVVPLLFLYKYRGTKLSFGLLFYVFLIIAINIIRESTIADYLLLFLPIIIGYLIATRLPTNLCIRAFCNIVFFLTVYSLLFYIPCAFFPALASLFPFIGYHLDSSVSVHDALFSVVTFGSQSPRNYGITWEPGAFALLLCIAVFCTIFCYESISKKRLLIYSIGIISTFSTMGYIVLFIIFICFLSIKKNSNVSIFIIFSNIFFVTFSISFMNELTVGKLDGLFTSPDNLNRTTESRIDAIIYPGLAFIESPFIGIGYLSFRIMIDTFNLVPTNTVINWFAVFGATLGVPFTFFYLYSINKFLKHRLNWLFLCLIFVVSIFLVSTESLFRISLIYVIIFFGTLKDQDLMIIDNG